MKSLLVLASTILHANARLRCCAGAFVPAMKPAPDGHPPRGGRGRGGSNFRPGRATVAIPSQRPASSPGTASPRGTGGDGEAPPSPPLYLEEGLLAVHKPLTWTSNDVVSYIRGILTRDAHERGAVRDEGGSDRGGGRGGKKRWNRRKGPLIKVGHGGTLDPLASGVLVLGVGKGTSYLQSYLDGAKEYAAVAELGYETDTLDAEGKLVRTAPWEHVGDVDAVRERIVPKFTGRIEQVPPLYSAIRVDGKRLYEIARKDKSGKAAENVEIPKREVEIHELTVGTALGEDVVRSGVVDGTRYREAARSIEEAAEAKAAKAAAEAAAKDDDGAKDANAIANTNDNANYNKQEGGGSDEGSGRNKKRRKRNRDNKKKGNFKKSPFDESTVPSVLPEHSRLELPRFALSLKCGGGTYVRSLVRDVGLELDTVATMTGLVRIRQGPFVLGDALRREDWTAAGVYGAIRRGREKRGGCDEGKQRERD